MGQALGRAHAVARVCTWVDEAALAATWTANHPDGGERIEIGTDVEHTTTIETETRGKPVGNSEHHHYHRWVCSCGQVGPWGHAVWAKVSIASAQKSAQRHVAEVGHEDR